MHAVAAVGNADEIAGLTDDGHANRRKANTYRRIPGGKVLTHPAPAKAGRDGFSVCLIADRAAQASTSNHAPPSFGLIIATIKCTVAAIRCVTITVILN